MRSPSWIRAAGLGQVEGWQSERGDGGGERGEGFQNRLREGYADMSNLIRLM